MSEMLNFTDLIENNKEIQPMAEMIQQIMELPDNSLNDQTIEIMNGMVNGALTPSVRQQSIKNLIEEFEEQGLTRSAARATLDTSKEEINQFIKQLQPSEKKQLLLDNIFKIFFEIFDEAVAHYHNENIELPIQLEEGARVPTYAHEEDVAADLYAADTVVVPAHSISNMIRTGVHIGLPEGWMAFIFPRSSIGAKTGLRLSNSAGIIDTGYRGPLGILYDNISDSDYTINAGDRIAQLLVMPTYHFKAKVVNNLEDSERGQGGFGSSGK